MEIINLGNLVVNTYLVKIEDKLVLVDTGYPGGHVRFLEKLSENNIDPENIDFLILTHAHDDHAGFLKEALAVTRARLVVHEKSAARLLLGHNEWIGGCSGTLAFVFVKAMGLFGKGKHEYPKLEIPRNAIVCNGEKQFFEENGMPIRIISLPGHTEDHMGVLVDRRVLFCGDAAMNGFPSIKRNIIWIENLEEYKASWDKMIAMDFDFVYPAHGKPFRKDDLRKFRNHLNKLEIRKIRAKT